MIKLLPKQARGVLGRNARSLWYANLESTRAGAQIANDKLATKRLLQKAGIPAPRLYATITSRQELRKFRWTKLPASFVIKPRSSYGGGGILIVFGRNKKGNWIRADGSEISIAELKDNVLDILDGNFSTANVPDIALFEQRVKNHPALKPYCARGVADVRILVYNTVPVMAMLRLPTVESNGRANLHAGGIGVGLDLARGITTTAIYRGRIIDTIPGTRTKLAGITLPDWQVILLNAVRTSQAMNLPFTGIDLALDREDGPLVLEANARPGLEIQLANLAPLRTRLERVKDLVVKTSERGVKLGQSLFGADIEQEIAETTGKTVLGLIEPVQIYDNTGQPHTILAKIDTGAWRTTLDETFAQQFNLHHPVIDHQPVSGALGIQERPIIELTIKLRERTIKTKAFIVDRSHMKYNMIVGRRDLNGFLVDPHKNARGLH